MTIPQSVVQSYQGASTDASMRPSSSTTSSQTRRSDRLIESSVVEAVRSALWMKSRHWCRTSASPKSSVRSPNTPCQPGILSRRRSIGVVTERSGTPSADTCTTARFSSSTNSIGTMSSRLTSSHLSTTGIDLHTIGHDLCVPSTISWSQWESRCAGSTGTMPSPSSLRTVEWRGLSAERSPSTRTRPKDSTFRGGVGDLGYRWRPEIYPRMDLNLARDKEIRDLLGKWPLPTRSPKGVAPRAVGLPRLCPVR